MTQGSPSRKGASRRSASSRSKTRPPAADSAIYRLAFGIAWGVLFAQGSLLLMREMVPRVVVEGYTPVLAAFGAALGYYRARAVVFALSVAVAAAILVIGYTPLAQRLMAGLLIEDPPRPAPAVVVLSADTRTDGSIDFSLQERLIRGYALLREGYAKRIVLTRAPWPGGSNLSRVRGQMASLGLDYPIDEVGPVRNTHDEAVAVARLARQRGWPRVLLVSQPWHLRRAAGVFAGAGLPVCAIPCAESRYQVRDLNGMKARLDAFRNWMHETIGYRVYRRRGWIK